MSAAALQRAGFGRNQTLELVGQRALTRVVRGIYLVGDEVLTRSQALRVGLLLAGDEGCVAGRSGAEFRGLLPMTDHRFDVLAPRARRQRELETEVLLEDTGLPARIRIRPTVRIPVIDTVDALPHACVSRLLLDLAANEGGQVAWTAWREAGFLRLLDHDDIDNECGKGRAGTAILKQLLKALPIVQTTETDAQTRAEYALIEELIKLGLPRPRSNMPMHLDASWYFPDVFSVEFGKVVEVDGTVHRDPIRAGEDRLRDAHIGRHGIPVKRVDRDAVLADTSTQAALVYAWLLDPTQR